VFVLTHHARAPIEMAGGTTFYFVTEGVQGAAERAIAAAKGRDVRVGGGVATIQQFLRAGLIDELLLAFSAVLLGSGEAFFANVDMVKLGYQCVERVATEKATHVMLRK
jgi:dihydrofolate reductase